jgi:LPXTG-site transpeptidase (sortase) family protein
VGAHSRGERTLRLVAWSLVAVGTWFLATAALGYAEARHAQGRLDDALRTTARAGATSPASVTAGAPFPWRLTVPRLRLSVAVMEGASARTLAVAAGHILGTRRPGQRGAIGIAAHRDTFFRPLRGVRPGDLVSVETPRGRFDYVVESVAVVAPDDTSALRATGSDALVLVTCFPFTFVGPAPNRLVVRCVPALRLH